MHCAPWQWVDNVEVACLVLKWPFCHDSHSGVLQQLFFPCKWERGDFVGERPRPADLHFKALKLLLTYKNPGMDLSENERFCNNSPQHKRNFLWGPFGKYKTILNLEGLYYQQDVRNENLNPGWNNTQSSWWFPFWFLLALFFWNDIRGKLNEHAELLEELVCLTTVTPIFWP